MEMCYLFFEVGTVFTRYLVEFSASNFLPLPPHPELSVTSPYDFLFAPSYSSSTYKLTHSLIFFVF